ncbi:MAG: substrate-binding domain-containing protein, partial [Coriobacteriales bacterium]|nr:substrate-binding domain-containing protein [Coriobacteriales bacterium]
MFGTPRSKRRLALLFSVVLALSVVLFLPACSGGQGNGGFSGGTDGQGGGGQAGHEGSAGAISVVAREDGSGTRSAFIELFEVQETVGDEKVDQTTVEAIITNSTAVMLTTIAGDPQAIGYISLGSLDDSVKALDIDGVAATTANVKSGAYKIQRPFNLITGAAGALSPAAQDFLDFVLSSEGQKVVEDNHYVSSVDGAKAYQASPDTSGKIVVAGSSSVTPVMEKL